MAESSEVSPAGPSGKGRVLFVSEGADAPSTRYRAMAFFPGLAAAGFAPLHETVPDDWRGRLRLAGVMREAAVTIILRKTLSGWSRLLFRAASRKLVLDIDDAVFVRDDGSASGTRARRWRGVLRACDAVFAGNAYLAEQAKAGMRGGRRMVEVLPTAVDPARYTGVVANATRPADHIDLVWIGSASTRKYLEGIVPAIAEAGKAEPRLRVKIIADFDLAIPGVKVLPIQWSEQSEAGELANSHIGLAPMHDDAWTRGKCGLKVLQYMASRLPVIASDVGVHRDMIRHGESGLLCGTDSEWSDAILGLANDALSQQQLAAGAHATFSSTYALSVVQEAMIRALDRLISD